MKAPKKILKQVKRRVQSVTYGNPIYRMVLDHGPTPDSLRLLINDPWPGDAQAGQSLMVGQRELFDDKNASLPCSAMPYPARCLRDLRAVGSENARRQAVEMILKAMERLEIWREEDWDPDVLGERIAAWISFYEFYSQVDVFGFQESLLACLARQLRHLVRLQPTPSTGVAGLKIIKGLIYGGLALIESEQAVVLALDLLKRQLASEILPDGGHISRNPSVQFHVLRYLVDIRAALRAARLDDFPELDLAIERMVPALKLFRHGDGGLALFHGGREENTLWIEAALTLAEARGRALRRLPQTGFERLTAGRSLLLIDASAPPPKPYDTQAHAGLLSFEFSVGRERFIVNCGAAPENDAAWRQALAATAAHSTLTVQDTNACEVQAEGLGHRPREVTGQRFEEDGAQCVEMMHDGYVGSFHVMHQRTLRLSLEGNELRGREVLSGNSGCDFTLRWHLHPAVQASLLQSGDAVLLRLASGAGWRLRISGGDLAVESSIYCGGEKPRRSLQVKFSGRTHGETTEIEWVLSRERKE